MSQTETRVISNREDAILRQCERLQTDLISREIGVALACAVFAFYLPPALVAAVYAVCVVTEVIQLFAYRQYRARAQSGWYWVMLANSFVALAAFSLLGLLLWQQDDPFIQFAAVMSLVGALVNVSSARATDLFLGLVCGIPPAAALLWLAASSLPSVTEGSTAALASFCVVVFLGYVGSALVQNNRVQTRLALASDRATAANAAKSRFLAEMSHDMRTPLNTILGLSQSLQDGDSLTPAARFAADIEAAARRLDALVADVLDLASAEEGNLVARPVTASIRRELSTALHASEARLSQSADVAVAADVPEFARFDPRLLRKVIVHLIDGLPGAGPTGPGTGLTVACNLSGRAAPAFEIALTARPAAPSDASPSAASALPKAADGPDADRTLGQTVVDRMTRLLGGDLLVNGTDPVTAVLTIPFQPVPDPPAPGTQGGTPLHVLVVDDIATNRFVIAQLLRTLDARAAEAESGPAALSILENAHFDLVLLDMNMPGMDGEATFRAIRSSERSFARIPVLALTADGLAEHRERYLALGLDGFVPKPVDKRLLWAEMSAVVR